LGIDDMPSSYKLKEDVVRKSIDHSLQNLFLHLFPLIEEDVINDSPS
jgi:hypothetical protein